MTPRSASVADDEIAQFSAHADDWWNADGAFRPLHELNPIRLSYIRARIEDHFVERATSTSPKTFLKGLQVLDVGCGGGLLTEPLARLGGDVTGIDASASAIVTAKAHAAASRLVVDYRCMSLEDMAHSKRQFDLITALEIVEHVADLTSFMQALAQCLKPGGLVILSTLNRTPKSFLLGIAAAEYILRWVPRGTHSWKKFVRPSELLEKGDAFHLKASDLTGVIFNPFTGSFELAPSKVDVNYMMSFVKSGR